MQHHFERPLQLLSAKTVFGLGGRRRAWEAKHAESRYGKPIRAAQTGGRAVKFTLGWPRIAQMDWREE